VRDYEVAMGEVVLVGEEVAGFGSLQQKLRPRRDPRKLVFAASAERAFEHLEAGNVDLVISAMRMPGMSGQAFLTQVRDRFPAVARFLIVAGRSSAELRAATVAHQTFAPSCDLGTMLMAVERCYDLNELLGSEAMRKAVAALGNLPAVPRIYSALVKALADPDVSVAEVARIVEQDMALTARVLQITNSALFGVQHHVTTVKSAISYLGINTLEDFVLSAEIFKAFESRAPIRGFNMEELLLHSQFAATIAARLPVPVYLKEAVSLGALLHDVGKMIMAAKLPQQLSSSIAAAGKLKCPLYSAEQHTYRVTHAEIGAYLLGLWGLPFTVVEAVAYHHQPTAVEQNEFDPIAAVYVANILAHEHAPVPAGADPLVHPELDTAYLGELGIGSGDIDSWRVMAQEAFATSAALK
jgi:putative nucleotidyltransferase with HDIG domain